MEAAEKNAEELRSATSPEQTVYLVRRGEWKNTQEFKECKHCGRMNHREEDCRIKDAECYRCQKKGHTSAVCKGKTEEKAHWTSANESDIDLPDEYALF